MNQVIQSFKGVKQMKLRESKFLGLVAMWIIE